MDSKKSVLVMLIIYSFLSSIISGIFAQSYNFQFEEIHYSTPRWTGVAVANTGRIFVNFPRWSTVPFSVAEIVDSQFVPFPNTEWNIWDVSSNPENHFVCDQSIYIDKDNYLWILDSASLNGSVVEGGPKLLKIDLGTNSIIKIIYFDETIAPPQSYLNDVRIDTEQNYAYITDSGLGAIIVIDLENGHCRRLLQDHYSTKAEFSTLVINSQIIVFEIHSDGLALTNEGDYLYYKALTANSLYRIETAKLMDTTLTTNELHNAVEFVVEAFPCDAIEFDQEGNLYFTAIQSNAIYYMKPNLEFELAVMDIRLSWPDSFSITPDGLIYVTTSRILFPAGLHGLFKITKTTTGTGNLDIYAPKEIELFQNYSNPSNPSTTIEYQINGLQFVSLRVYDILVNEEQQAGKYDINYSTDLRTN